MDFQIAESFAEFADLFVEESDFLEVSGVLFAFVKFGLGRFFGMGIVGRWEPNNGESSLFGGVFFQVFDGVIHCDDGALSFVLVELAVSTEVGMEIKEIEAGKPVVKTLSSGRGGAFFLDRADVPLAEMGGEIAI